MKVINQYIVWYDHATQILFECENNEWYITLQLDFRIASIDEAEAKTLLDSRYL